MVRFLELYYILQRFSKTYFMEMYFLGHFFFLCSQTQCGKKRTFEATKLIHNIWGMPIDKTTIYSIMIQVNAVYDMIAKEALFYEDY